MPYATQQDMIDAQGEDLIVTISDRDNNGAIDTAAVTKALAAASSEIDSYLANRYVVPVASPSAMLANVCIDIAIYRLAARAAALTEEMRLRYTDAIAWLKEVAKGNVEVIGATPPGSETTEDATGVTENTGGNRAGVMFARATTIRRWPGGVSPVSYLGRKSDWRRRMRR